MYDERTWNWQGPTIVAISNLLLKLFSNHPSLISLLSLSNFNVIILNNLLKFVSRIEVYWANMFSSRFELYNHLIRDFHHVSHSHLQSLQPH